MRYDGITGVSATDAAYVIYYSDGTSEKHSGRADEFVLVYASPWVRDALTQPPWHETVL